MMFITAGSTDVSLPVYFVDDDGGTAPGEPTTGLLFSDIETGGSASYQRQGAARVDLELITRASPSSTHADGGFILIDDTNMPGLYRVDYPDLAFTTGADFVIIQMVAASGKNTIMRPLLVMLPNFDLQSATPTVDTIRFAGDVIPTPAVTGVPDVNVTHMVDGVVPLPLVTGVPEVDVTHWKGGITPSQAVTGVPKVDLDTIRSGTVPPPSTAGILDVNVERWLDTLVTLSASTPDVNVQSVDTDAISAAALSVGAVNKIRNSILPEQNVALSNIPFVFVLASDGRTIVTGATGMSVERSINAGAFGAGTGTIAEISDGAYQYDASAADMDGGIITFKFSATGGTPGVPADTFLTIVTGGGV